MDNRTEMQLRATQFLLHTRSQLEAAIQIVLKGEDDRDISVPHIPLRSLPVV